MTWGELKSAVLKYLDAEQDAERTAMLPTWRLMAESDIFNTLRTGWMVRRGEVLATDRVVRLPPSVIDIIGISAVNRTLTEAEVTEFGSTLAIADLASEPGQALEAIGPEQVEAASSGYRIFPRAYLVEGHELRLVPWPTGTGPFLCRFSYYSRGKDLTEDTDTNEVLHHIPAAYIYGMLRHAAIFSGDAEGEQRWSQALAVIIERANSVAYGWQGTGITMRRARAA
jgi:hypothetical protein